MYVCMYVCMYVLDSCNSPKARGSHTSEDGFVGNEKIDINRTRADCELVRADLGEVQDSARL